MAEETTQCVFSSMSGQLCVVVGVPMGEAEEVVRDVMRRANTGWGPERVVGDILRRLVAQAGDDPVVRAGQLQVGHFPTLRVRYLGRGSYTLTPPATSGHHPQTETFEVPERQSESPDVAFVSEQSPSWATTTTDIVVESMLGQVVFSAQMEAKTLHHILLRTLVFHDKAKEYSELVGTVLKTLSLRVSPPGGFTADVRWSRQADHTLWLRHLTAGRFVVATTEGPLEPTPGEWQVIDELQGFSNALAS